MVMLTTLYENSPYMMMLVAPLIVYTHYSRARMSLYLEWDPDYDSFRRMFRRLRQNHWRRPNDD